MNEKLPSYKAYFIIISSRILRHSSLFMFAFGHFPRHSNIFLMISFDLLSKRSKKNEGIKKWRFFYDNFQDGSWKFGLKDLGLSQSRVSKMNTFPLIGGQESEINLMEEGEEPGNLLNKTEKPFRLKGH